MREENEVINRQNKGLSERLRVTEVNVDDLLCEVVVQRERKEATQVELERITAKHVVQLEKIIKE